MHTHKPANTALCAGGAGLLGAGTGKMVEERGVSRSGFLNCVTVLNLEVSPPCWSLEDSANPPAMILLPSVWSEHSRSLPATTRLGCSSLAMSVVLPWAQPALMGRGLCLLQASALTFSGSCQDSVSGLLQCQCDPSGFSIFGICPACSLSFRICGLASVINFRQHSALTAPVTYLLHPLAAVPITGTLHPLTRSLTSQSLCSRHLFPFSFFLFFLLLICKFLLTYLQAGGVQLSSLWPFFICHSDPFKRSFL